MELPNVTVTLKCVDCRHEQEVTSACGHRLPDGTDHYYFGSRYDHCDVCDGPTQLLPLTKEVPCASSSP